MVKVTGVDHYVLVAKDVERTLAWYRDSLGMDELRGDEWRRGEAPFPSVRVSENTIIDFIPEGYGVSGEVASGGTNIDHVCLVIEPCDLSDVAAQDDIDAVGPPLRLFGARGEGNSLYVRDPDAHVVELRYYD